MQWSGRGEKSHQVGTVSGILTVVYFKNKDKKQKNTAAAESTDNHIMGLTAKP